MNKYVLGAVAALALLGCEKSKTGFVNTEKVVKEYQEMNTAQDKYTAMNEDMMKELEVKAQEYQSKVVEYQEDMKSMSVADRSAKEEQLMAERQQLQQEQQMRSRQLQEESQTAIDSVIKKVKDKVKEYGKDNGYDYIYGQNDAGSIMYGKESYDVTDAIIKSLNNGETTKKEDTK